MDEARRMMSRGDCYRILSACFCEPERELLAGEGGCSSLARLLDDVAPEAGKAALRMAQAIEEIHPEQMAIDYASLFVGPFGLVAPPYGSVYLEEGGRLMGDSTMEVLNRYREGGLNLDVREPPDHVAIELEFISYLCALEGKASTGGNEQRAGVLARRRVEFLERFLSPWVPEFCGRIRTGTENPFYVALADCLERFIEDETKAPAPDARTEKKK